MRMLQMIDSLEVGGAERIAVNFANTLASQIEFSGIVSTRKAGSLQSDIQSDVPYWCLHKRSALDLKALFKLRSICIENKVNWLHAHGTSYFQAFLLKLVLPKIHIIWHEHAGARATESIMQNKTLILCARFFDGIVVVNQSLERWCREKLKFNQVLYLPNFAMSDTHQKKETQLKGIDGKRILCLANLRSPKNHQLLVQAAVALREKYPDWTYHLVGNDAMDAYSDALKKSIVQNNLKNTVYIYGLRKDIHHIINQTSIAVITSESEGLPVALLEYGLNKKPVVSTAVGEIPQMIQNGVNGYIFDLHRTDLFVQALDHLMSDDSLQLKMGEKLFEVIKKNHSAEVVVRQYLNWINTFSV